MLESTFKIGIPAVWNIENSSFITQFITLVFVHDFCFFFNWQEKVRNMYHSIGFSVPDYEGNESDGRGSDEPIDVDTVDTEENHVPQSTKRTKPR